MNLGRLGCRAGTEDFSNLIFAFIFSILRPNVLVEKTDRTVQPGGHLAVVTKQRTTNNNSISKDKENHTVPDGDNV